MSVTLINTDNFISNFNKLMLSVTAGNDGLSILIYITFVSVFPIIISICVCVFTMFSGCCYYKQ